MPTRRFILAALPGFAVVSCVVAELVVGTAPMPTQRVYVPAPEAYAVEPWIDGLEVPWSVVSCRTGAGSSANAQAASAWSGPDGALYFTTTNRDGRGGVRPGDDHIYRLRSLAR